jgi:hypothetical protein
LFRRREIQLVEWLAGFGLDEFLRGHVAGVMGGLPDHVREDFLGDPGFVLFDYEPAVGAMMVVPVGPPRRNAAGRSVVLKRTLRRRPEAFVRYVIAHELAHAHLRNAGRWPGDDPEHAADALAAEWGFPRP